MKISLIILTLINLIIFCVVLKLRFTKYYKERNKKLLNISIGVYFVAIISGVVSIVFLK